MRYFTAEASETIIEGDKVSINGALEGEALHDASPGEVVLVELDVTAKVAEAGAYK